MSATAWQGIAYRVIDDLAELRKFLASAPEPYDIGFDIETRGVDPHEDGLVGFSLAFTSDEGVYVPVGHDSGGLGVEALHVVWPVLCGAQHVLAHNFAFEAAWLDCLGFDPTEISWCDTQILSYVTDSERSRGHALKELEELVLGWRKRPDFSSTQKANLAQLLPQDVAQYAVLDVCSPFLLREVLLPTVTRDKLEQVVRLDHDLVIPLMRLQQQEVPLDAGALQRQLNAGTQRVEQLKLDICRALNTPTLNPGSTQQLRRVLLARFSGLDLTDPKTGKPSTSRDVLARYRGQVPVIETILEWRSARKLVTSFLRPLAGWVELRGPVSRWSYRRCSVATGRLSAAAEKDSERFCAMNIQQVPSAGSALWSCSHTPDDPESILGWTFEAHDSGDVLVEGTGYAENPRSVFLPTEDHLWASFDYSGQELALAAILSGERVWIEAIREGRDLHMEMARRIFGASAGKPERKLAKAANFGILYGQSAWGFSQKNGVTEDEAEDIIANLKASVPKLVAYQAQLLHRAQSRSTNYSVRTAFGRSRRLERMVKGTKGQQAAARREALNAPIQGTGGDLIRYKLRQLYDKILLHTDYRGVVEWRSTVHDEINLSIHRDHLRGLVPRILDLLHFQPKGWPVGLSCGLQLGTSWGRLWEFRANADGDLEPKPEEAI